MKSATRLEAPMPATACGWMSETPPVYRSTSSPDWIVIDSPYVQGMADVEGTIAEMLALATAIESGNNLDAGYRCAVEHPSKGVIELSSPRNSRVPMAMSTELALEVARRIREVAAEPWPDGPSKALAEEALARDAEDSYRSGEER